MRSIGRLSGRLSSNKELMAGMMEGMDPRAIAEAINENADFMGKVTGFLDPKAIADSMNGTMSFAAEVFRYIDPEAAAEVMNKNQRILPRFVEHIDPNVFTRSTGAVMNKLRFATYRPPQFSPAAEEVEAKEESESEEG